MQLDWERDVKPEAERVGRLARCRWGEREAMQADVLSVSWELLNSGREFESVEHLMNSTVIRIKRRDHLDRGHRVSVEGKPINGEERLKRQAFKPRTVLEPKSKNSPESDGRLEGWLAKLTVKQRQMAWLLAAGWSCYQIAKERGVTCRCIVLTKRAAAKRLCSAA